MKFLHITTFLLRSLEKNTISVFFFIWQTLILFAFVSKGFEMDVLILFVPPTTNIMLPSFQSSSKHAYM